jgi:hypothetical protein
LQMAADGRIWLEEIDSAATSHTKDGANEPYTVYRLEDGL